MQQFRLVILDDYDNVISVEYESPIFEGESEFDKDISKAHIQEKEEIKVCFLWIRIYPYTLINLMLV